MRHHIVAIGISKHQNSFVSDLSYAAKDASEFFGLFTENISDVGYHRLLIDSESTLSQIRTALGSQLLQEIGPEDAFFFFYSGHGTTAEDADNRSLAHFLLPFDATLDISSSCISVSFLKKIFDNLACSAKFIFIDSCFSGSVNTKGYTNPNKKAFKILKTLGNTVTGNGVLSFSASKEDEEAIEDPEFENGLFTHCLLEELQKKRKEEKFAILDVFTPIAKNVTERAKEKYNHTQTPTLNSYLKGNVYIPTFRKPLQVNLQVLDVPKYPELSSAAFLIPELQLEDKQQEQIVNEMIDLVVKGRNLQQVSTAEIIFERFCAKLIGNLKKDWDSIFVENGGRVSEIPNAVAKLEAASFQFIILGGVVAVFGSEKQMQVYSECAVEILEMTKHRAGLVALISAPEIILAEIIYVVGALSLGRKNIKPFQILLKTNVDDLRDRDNPPQPLVTYKNIHYCKALGGYSSKVNDHIRDVLSNFSWMPELVPKLEGQVANFQSRVNFLLVMLAEHHDDTLWPDFARWDAWRITPLTRRIKYDVEFRRQVAELFGTQEKEIRVLFMNYLAQAQRRGLDKYFWSSVSSSDFFTEEEIRAEQEKKPNG